jgi:hypothetical protein
MNEGEAFNERHMARKRQKLQKLYYIVGSDGFWNNLDGWVEESDDATTFTQSERDAFSLPIGGRWALKKR